MNSTFRNKFFNLIALALVAALVMPWAAFADELVGDGDGLAPVEGKALNLGDISRGQSKSGIVLFAIQRKSATASFNKNENVTVSAGSPSSTSVSTSVTDAGIKMPGNWGNASDLTMTTDTATASVTVSAVGATCGEKSATILYTATGEGSNPTRRSTTLTVNWKVVNCEIATTLSVASASATYGGSATLSATLIANNTGVSGKSVSFMLAGMDAGTALTNSSGVASVTVNLGTRSAGSYPIGASFAGDTTHAGSSGSSTLTVGKANATVNVSGFSGAYDGNPHGATGTATGISNENLNSLLNLGNNFTDVPGGTANWTFAGNTNYNSDSGSVNIVIGQADATIKVDGYSGIYDGNAHGATGTAKGVQGEDLNSLLNLGATYTDAGTYTVNWSFAGNGNYKPASGTVTIQIDKAAASIDVRGYTGIYDGNAHGATGTAKGVQGEDLSSLLDLGDSFTNGGTHTANWSFAGNDNYNSASGTATIQINKAEASTVVNGYSGTYDGNAHGATGTAKGVQGEDLSSLLDLGASYTDAPGGTATWMFMGDDNYNPASGSVSIAIAKADATIEATGYEGIYDGSAHGATGTAKGVQGEDLSSLLDLGASFSDAGTHTATWSFAGNANYNAASGSVSIAIAKADATIKVDGYTGAYDGNPHGATGSATGVKDEDLSSLLDLGDSFSDAGVHMANWSFMGNANYNAASGSVSIAIGEGAAIIEINGYSGTYDGNAHGATGTAKGVQGEDLSSLLDLGASFSDAGVHMANWSFAGNANYKPASGTAKIEIDKATATIGVDGYTGAYDGNTHGATGSATGVKDEDLSSLLDLGASFSDAGTHTATWSFAGNANYNAASGSVSIAIAKADATIKVDGYTGAYDGNPHGATGSATGVQDEDLSSLLDLGASYTDAPGGTASWTFMGNANYNAASGTAKIQIDKASQAIAFGPLSNKSFGDAPFTVSATGGASGNQVTFAATGNCTVSGSTVTIIGKGSCTLTASQAGNTNYNAAQSVSQSFAITGWKVTGFYSPVDMSPLTPNTINWNTVKNGSTVPLKFNIFGSIERTSTSDIQGFTQAKVTCSAGTEDVVDPNFLTTGGTSLRYSGTPGVDGQFIQNWQTPKTVGSCYKVTMTARDGSAIEAFFKLK